MLRIWVPSAALRCPLPSTLELMMQHHTGLHFTTAFSLEDLAKVIEMDDPLLDWENEYEWAIGTCDGIENIDICRTHKVSPIETKTTILRYAHGMDSVIPKEVMKKIASRLIAHGIAEIEITGFNTLGSGFLEASALEELGL